MRAKRNRHAREPLPPEAHWRNMRDRAIRNPLSDRQLAESLTETIADSLLIKHRFDDLKEIAATSPVGLANVSDEELTTLIMSRFFTLTCGALARTKPKWTLRIWRQFQDFETAFFLEGFNDRAVTTRARKTRFEWIDNQLSRYEATPLERGRGKSTEPGPEFILWRYRELVEENRKAGKRRYGQAAIDQLHAELRELGSRNIGADHLRQNILPEAARAEREGRSDPAHRWRFHKTPLSAPAERRPQG